MTVQPSDYYLSRLAVAAGTRRRGIGRRLLHRFEAEGAERGVTRLALDVSADNTAAIGLYESCGFSRLDVSQAVDDGSGRTIAYVHMAKSIA